MTSRPHLVERAVEALQEQARLAQAPLPRPAPPAQPAPVQQPAAAPAKPEPVSLETLESAGMVARPAGGARSRLGEEIALVRQQLLRGIPKVPPGNARSARVIMVTSARPGDGKTFISLNLAAAIAEGAAMRVLLVDADGRRGSLGDKLGLAGQPGLRALATTPALQPAALARPTAIPLLSLMTCGSAPGAAEAAPPGEAIAEAVRRIAAAFPDHLIVLDMPPALSTSDAGALAPLAGQVVMVVLAERTQKNEVEAALDVVDACPDIRLLLNRAGLTLNDSFGAYGGYDGYGGGDLP